MIEIDGVSTGDVDVDSPTIYSIQWTDEDGREWQVLLERTAGAYLIRQILVLNADKSVLYDVTCKPECVTQVKSKFKGDDVSGVLSWVDLNIELKHP